MTHRRSEAALRLRASSAAGAVAVGPSGVTPAEWVPVAVGASSGVVVGIAGVIATYKAGKRQADTSVAVAERQVRAAADASREERNQRRLEAAYPPLLDVLTQGHEWIWKLESYVSTGSDERPCMPEAVRDLRNHGAISSVWSPQVAALVNVWSRAAGLASVHATRLGHTWEHRPREFVPTPPGFERLTQADVFEGRVGQVEYLVSRFTVALKASLAAEAEIRQQVWQELRGERDGSLDHEVLRWQAFEDLSVRPYFEDQEES